MSTKLIKKASGQMEPFLVEKLESSLQRSGADPDTIRAVVSEVNSWLNDGVSTRKIYAKAFASLRRIQRSAAARYSLKKAIMELGPSGYPFEHFIGQVFKLHGYTVEVGQVVEGHCVKHEVDVVATSNGNQNLIECKYYNSQGKFASVQVPLYIRSRVDDIIRKRQSLPEFKGLKFNGWIVTNTRFTSDAMDFGKCSGLHLLSWDYPQGNSLKDLIENQRIFPITTLTELPKSDKQKLLEKGIVLCRQLADNPELIDMLMLKADKKRKVLQEVTVLCG